MPESAGAENDPDPLAAVEADTLESYGPPDRLLSHARCPS
jgi:hypothetical protein